MTPVLTCIETAAFKALLGEVGATPKPGLVDKHDSGAHKDMCYHTFELSTQAVVPYITEMARAGLMWKGSLSELFHHIRPLGVNAEEAMFSATGGVNTHKGIIFSMGIIAAAAGFYYAGNKKFDSQAILLSCRPMTYETLEQDFKRIDPDTPKTHGEKLYVRYGCKGIRGEAQNGFPAVRTIGLPCMRRWMKEETDSNLAYIQVLMTLMSRVEDTNILTRSDPETLSFVKEEAARILEMGGAFTEEGLSEIRILNQIFVEKNISPGGCADLLAITIFLWLLEQYQY
ncbi:triphosphoribosyl-dephospho-CoA synthase CitG [Clostridium sp. MCC353]|uniref:triphosphoribosyl-dephospho-CoA synthase CitG n=1 Tax=Clostridium sp. MCC353 TaxID=2592646 RepID=UPI001C016723|nr:triphosphoribosyl-dephospho-CoA synthase CitG [Clostridium sp. MCC353]MBT9779312.1 triphosphoribosyl-dephospho-CoA synthase CitG [Clostridium sp. MCC353]